MECFLQRFERETADRPPKRATSDADVGLEIGPQVCFGLRIS